MRVKMAAAEAANCIMEVSAWSAGGGGGGLEVGVLCLRRGEGAPNRRMGAQGR